MFSSSKIVPGSYEKIRSVAVSWCSVKAAGHVPHANTTELF